MAYKFHYDKKYDVLYIRNAEKKVDESVEFSEDIVLDLDNEGKVIGVELSYASELFAIFNNEIDKLFLSSLKEARIEYKEFRNTWFVVLILNTGSKEISQVLPPLRKSEYISPLVANSI
ncbi:MAG: DUF2283 domain-containing protein [Candidatus Pacearchaeota archaeon]|jgi:uncharacterized protein YuzE